jgi:hypothetical protein
MFQHAVRTLKLRLKSPLEKWIHSVADTLQQLQLREQRVQDVER